ncbi:uncharacterized protein LOC121602067 [Anopheles merus]|nr:uncharacterized protein LOC121602067 [Anopheles merus]
MIRQFSSIRERGLTRNRSRRSPESCTATRRALPTQHARSPAGTGCPDCAAGRCRARSFTTFGAGIQPFGSLSSASQYLQQQQDRTDRTTDCGQISWQEKKSHKCIEQAADESRKGDKHSSPAA